MKQVATVCCLFLILIPFWTLSAQDTLIILRYPSEKEIEETVYGTVTRETTGYRYNYQISNARSARQSIWLALVVTEGSVVSLTSPEGWDVDLTSGAQARRRVEWGASDTTYFIKPGETIGGFSILSKNPPTITNYYAKGWIELPKVDIEPDSIIGAGDVFETSKLGFTIAPLDPPSPFVATVFLDTLISYKHQAFALGWIADKPFERELDNHLDNARKHLTRGDSVKCADEVVKFQDRIQKERRKTEDEEKHKRPRGPRFVTSEGYALLFFNAQYIVDRLPEKKTPGPR